MIERLIATIAAFGPVGIMLAYGIIRARGDWRNDALWVAFCVGSLFCFLAIAIEFVAKAGLAAVSLSPLARAFADASVVAALPEEAVKLVALRIALNHVDARRMQDVILLSLAAALGFAAMENFFSIVGSEGWGFRAVLRAGTAIPGHALDGLAMGAFLSLARMSDGKRKLWLCLTLLAPVGLHTAYDFPLMAMATTKAPWLPILWLAVLLLSAVLVTLLSDRVLAAATRWDRSRMPASDLRSNRVVIAIGLGFVATGVVLAVLTRFLVTAAQNRWDVAGMVIGFLPVFFGLDLVRVGRSGAFRASRTSAAA